ncbi:hypothetical protein NK280_23810, partial [Salmonella enterica]|nr:hypothetical protein [Salmonella enterica]
QGGVEAVDVAAMSGGIAGGLGGAMAGGFAADGAATLAPDAEAPAYGGRLAPGFGTAGTLPSAPAPAPGWESLLAGEARAMLEAGQPEVMDLLTRR